jgi:hypothetical protein
MEQDEKMYEYRMGHEVFRFEAQGHKAAVDYRPYVLLHFRELMGSAFSEDALKGPIPVKLPDGALRMARKGLHLQPQAWGS